MTQTQGCSEQGMDIENDYPSLVLSCAYRMSPPQAPPPATGLQPCLNQVSGLPGSQPDQPTQCPASEGPSEPKPRKVHRTWRRFLCDIGTYSYHAINTYLAERSRPLVLAQEKPCVCHCVEGRWDKGCFGGVYVNTAMVILGAQVYVCLYSVGG